MRALIAACWSSIDDHGGFVRYLLLSLFAALLGNLTPLLAGLMINMTLASGDVVRSIALAGAVLAALCCVSNLCSYKAVLLYTYLQADSSFELDLRATGHIQHLPHRFFNDFDPSYWRKRLDDDTNGLSLFFLQALTGVGENVIAVAIAAVSLFMVSPLVCILCLVSTAASNLSYRIFSEKFAKSQQAFVEEMARYSAIALWQLAKIPFIRRNVLFERGADEMRRSYSAVRPAMYKTNCIAARMTLFADVTRSLSLAIVLIVAAVEVASGHIEAGFVATVYGYFTTLVTSMEYFLKVGREYQQAKVNLGRLTELWERKVEDVGEACVRGIKTVRMRDVTCELEAGRTTFDGVSATFAKGRLYGIVGPNGSGKSTLMTLLSGDLRGCWTGEVTLDGTPIDDIDQYDLRTHEIGYVEQDPVMIRGTLRDNLTLLCDGPVSDERLLDVMREVGLDAIAKVPDALGMQLGEGGRQLSGGEGQKVAIARVILKDPGVVFLDEPTSALDEGSRERLLAVLDDLKRSRIVITVSHDPELLAACDEVLQMS